MINKVLLGNTSISPTLPYLSIPYYQTLVNLEIYKIVNSG